MRCRVGLVVVTLYGSFVTAAAAADIPVQFSRASPPITYYNWSGFYFGAHAGYNWAQIQGAVSSSTGLDASIDQRMQGGLAGGQFGVNHQLGRAVIGLELSGSWIGGSGNSDCFGSGNFWRDQGTTFDCTLKQKWTTRLLGHFGYAPGDGRLLTYILGGVALTELETEMQATNLNPPPPAITIFSASPWGASKLHQGAVVGAGAQYAIGAGFSLGLEYLYTIFGAQDHGGTALLTAATGGFPTFTALRFFPTSLNLTNHAARLVVNYKFD